MKSNRFARLVRLGLMSVLSLSAILAINFGPTLLPGAGLQSEANALQTQPEAGASQQKEVNAPQTQPEAGSENAKNSQQNEANAPQTQPEAGSEKRQKTPENAKNRATAANEVATGSTWTGASFPVENFQEYTSPFGPRGYGEFHYGLDLAAPQGSYIRNWWAGAVVEVIDDNRCGTGLVIESGNWEHVYCHMEGQVERSNGRNYLIDREGGIQLWEGQQVPAGARIGRVGMSGRTSGPHLHWGLKYSQQWIDPATVLRAMYSEQSPSYSSRPQGY